MTIDVEGMLWIAHWGGGRVTRWDPYSGRLLQTVFLPVSLVTSCSFGGEALDELYITSARVGLTAGQLREEPHAGSLFVIKGCGVNGSKADRFIGSPAGEG